MTAVAGRPAVGRAQRVVGAGRLGAGQAQHGGDPADPGRRRPAGRDADVLRDRVLRVVQQPVRPARRSPRTTSTTGSCPSRSCRAPPSPASAPASAPSATSRTGFYDRLLLAPGSRPPLFVGPIIAGIARCTFTLVAVLALGLVLGVEMTDVLPGLLDAVGRRGRAWPSSPRAGRWAWCSGCPTRARARSCRSGSSSPRSCPPATCPSRTRSAGPSPSPPSTRSRPCSQLARQGFLGEVAWHTTWPGLLAIAGSTAALWLWAVTGLKRLTP